MGKLNRSFCCLTISQQRRVNLGVACLIPCSLEFTTTISVPDTYDTTRVLTFSELALLVSRFKIHINSGPYHAYFFDIAETIDPA